MAAAGSTLTTPSAKLGVLAAGDALMSKFEFYSEVRVLPNAETESSGIADHIGVVMGISEDPAGASYAVSIDGVTNMVKEANLEATGRIFSREDFYDGSSIAVAPQRYVDDAE